MMMKAFAVALCLLAVSVSAQTQTCRNANPPAPPSPPSPDSAREVAGIAITPLTFCKLKRTDIILGYIGFKPVYQNKCEGLCLSTRAQPRVCVAQTRRIRVSTVPPYISPNGQVLNPAAARGASAAVDPEVSSISGEGPAVFNPRVYSRIVNYVYDCNCNPAPCVVTVNGVSTTYQHGQTVFDSCNRKCTCSFGRLINCCRQRKEFRTGMTSAERQRYINAVLAISAVGNPLKPQFDALIQKHATLFSSGIHGATHFFPWHRQYIYDLENLLQQYDCRVTVPYWRWSLEAANPFASTIWNNAPDALGGNGGGSCITTGPFAQSAGWLTSEPVPQCLKRNWITSATFATESQIATTTHTTCPANFNCFLSAVQGYHNYVHVAVGGQMGTTVSSNDPVFFLHHTYIDFLWAKWQAKSYSNLWALSGSANSSMPGTTYTPADFMDLNAQYGDPNQRVCYVEPTSIQWVGDLFENLAVAKAVIPSVAPQPFPEAWLTLMGFTKEQIAAERAAFCTLQSAPNTIPQSQALAGGPLSATLGVQLSDSHFKQAGLTDDEGSTITMGGCISTPEEDNDGFNEVFEQPISRPTGRFSQVVASDVSLATNTVSAP